MVRLRWAIAAMIAAFLSTQAAPVARASLLITTGATQNMSCSGGSCTATAAFAVFNNVQLDSMLASGTAFVNSGSLAKDIVVAAPIAWSTASELNLEANRSLTIDQPITVQGTAGVNLFWSQGSLGSLVFGNEGRVSFANIASTLYTNNAGIVVTNWKLVNSIASLKSAINASPGGSFALSNNYDASADGIYSTSPIAVLNGGVVSGLGNAISNLQIRDTTAGAHVGLFGTMDHVSRVEYLHLKNPSIHGAGQSSRAAEAVGALVGLMQDRSEIYEADVTGGSVTAGAGDRVYAGALAGEVSQYANISQCHANTGVTAGLHAITAGKIGGLAGAVIEGSIFESYAMGGVAGGPGAMVGGLVGLVGLGSTATSTSGDNGIQDTYATGRVSVGPGGAVGGLIGVNCPKPQWVGNCFVGYSYSTGLVSGASATRGGLIGIDYDPNFLSLYWDTTTSGQTRGLGSPASDPNVVGLTTAQFQSGLPAGLSSAIWIEKSTVNNGLPYLIQPPR